VLPEVLQQLLGEVGAEIRHLGHSPSTVKKGGPSLHGTMNMKLPLTRNKLVCVSAQAFVFFNLFCHLLQWDGSWKEGG
jgi:hypothetical protein